MYAPGFSHPLHCIALGPCARSIVASITSRHCRHHPRQTRQQPHHHRRRECPFCRVRCCRCSERRRKCHHCPEPIRNQHIGHQRASGRENSGPTSLREEGTRTSGVEHIQSVGLSGGRRVRVILQTTEVLSAVSCVGIDTGRVR